MRAIRIVILAKVPTPGFAKTRLIPALGADGAALLAKKLLHHTINQALLASVGPVELCLTSNLTHGSIQALTLPDELIITEQGGGDLGQRMSEIVERVTQQEQAVLLIGTDCPALDCQTLQNAASALDSHESVMVPACDGGYVLLGLRHFNPSIFSNIPWSTSKVADLTRQKIAMLQWSLKELDELHDIDEPCDLQWLPKHLQDTLNV